MGRSSYGHEPWCAWFVPCIFLACIGLFVYTMYVNNCPETTGRHNCIGFAQLGRYSFQPISQNPLLGPASYTLEDLGGLNPKLVIDKDQTYRLFTYMWLHSGVFHLLANMICLMATGIGMEEEFGFLRIGTLYILSGLGGGLLSCLHAAGTKDRVTVGASGALFGLLGSSLSELIINWTMYSNKCSALCGLLMILILNLCIGIIIPGVDQSAHYGGFFTGYLLGFILLMRPDFEYISSSYLSTGYDVKRKPKYNCYQYVLFVMAVVTFLTGAMVGVTKLIRGETMNLPLPGFNTS